MKFMIGRRKFHDTGLSIVPKSRIMKYLYEIRNVNGETNA